MDLVSFITPTAALIAALGALPLASFAQQRPENRLRSAIAANFATLEELSKVDLEQKKKLQSRIEEMLAVQFENLLEIERRRVTEKLRNWPSLAASVVLVVLIATPMWLMWKPVGFWPWLIFIFLGAMGLLFLLAGISACFSQEQNRKRVEKVKGTEANR